MKNLFLLFTVLVLTSCFAYSQQVEDMNYPGNGSRFQEKMSDGVIDITGEESQTYSKYLNLTGSRSENFSSKKLSIGLGAGANIPVGEFGKYHKIGPAAYLDVGYRLNENMNLRMDFQFSVHEYDISKQFPGTTGYGYSSYYDDESATFLYMLDFNLLYGNLSRISKFNYYGIGGIGAAFVGWADYTKKTIEWTGSYYETTYEYNSPEMSVELTAKVGGGIKYRLSSLLSIVGELQFRYITGKWQEKINTSVPIKLGMTLDL